MTHGDGGGERWTSLFRSPAHGAEWWSSRAGESVAEFRRQSDGFVLEDVEEAERSSEQRQDQVS